MSLRIPLTKDQTLQVEFHEIERRLRKLEQSLKTTGTSTVVRVSGGGSSAASVNLTPILERIEALESAIAEIETSDPSTYGLVGSGASPGIVPSPGTASPPTGVAQHVLTEDEHWGFPLRGLVGVATSGEQAEPPYDVVDVAAGLHVSGASAFGQVVIGTARIMSLVPNGTLAVCEDDLSVAGLI